MVLDTKQWDYFYATSLVGSAGSAGFQIQAFDSNTSSAQVDEYGIAVGPGTRTLIGLTLFEVAYCKSCLMMMVVVSLMVVVVMVEMVVLLLVVLCCCCHGGSDGGLVLKREQVAVFNCCFFVKKLTFLD